MSILRVLKYLVMGVVVGAVLFFAGFGVLNLVDKNAESEVVQNPTAVQESISTELTPPTITVNSTADPAGIVNDANNPIKIKPLDSDDQSADTAATDEADAVAFGSLTLRTVTAARNEPVNADFLIQNSESAVIALVKKTASTTLSLPVGNYKITVTQADQKIVRFLGVREGQQGAEVFELDLSDAVAKANTPAAGSVPLIADETTSVTETSTSETSELVNEVAPVAVEGSDEVTTTVSETTTDVTTVETDTTQTATADTEITTEGADTVVTETATAEQGVGGLRVSALTEEGKRPVKASFYIQRLNGENVDNKKNVETQQFSLPAGRYRVTARTPDVRLVKDLDVLAGKGLHQIFLIPEPETASASVPRTPTPAAPARVVVPTPVPAAPQASTVVTPAPEPVSSEPVSDGQTGRLELFAQRASNQSAVKSNFYVQTPDGKLVTNKTYVDSIGYKLPVGQYRVTVRATGFVDKTVEVRVRDGQTRREVFKLESVDSAPQAAPAAPVQTQIPVIPPAPIVVQPPVVVPAAPQVQQQTNPANPNNRGGLQVNIISARDGSGLIADIAVVNGNGRVIRRADGVSTANFDLPAREFMVRVIYGGLITNEKVMIQSRKIAIKTIRFSDRPNRQQRDERGVRQ